MTTLDTPRQRTMNDLLSAERAMREQNEKVLRGFNGLLHELAGRLDGTRFQNIQRDSPRSPSAWSVDEWKAFFDEVNLATGWNAPQVRENREIAELIQKVEEYERQIAQLENALKQERVQNTAAPVGSAPQAQQQPADKKSKAVPRLAPSPVLLPLNEDELTPPLETIMRDVRAIMPGLPKRIPAPFDKVLGGKRNGTDLDQAIQRYWIMLYLIGRWRLSAWLEIDAVTCPLTNVQSGAGSVSRAMKKDLNKKNFVVSETIALPYTSLALHRLSPEGERLFESVFDAKPVENEWARINRLHQGEREPQHTMAIIACAIHARARGYSTRVLPDNRQTSTPPDLWIERGEEKLYVEVELSEKENPVKWKNQAAMNNGKVAICAGTINQRDALVADCKAMKLTGYAMNLEAIVKAKPFDKITPDDPLWLEVW